MMTPKQMVSMVRSHLAVNSSFLPGETVMQLLHAAQQELIRDIIRTNPSFYVTSTSLSFVAGQALYDLPMNARLGTRFIFVENSQSDDLTSRVPPAGVRERFFLEGPNLLSMASGWSFVQEGSKVRVVPTPTSDAADALTIWYCPQYGNMIQGIPTYVSTSPTTLLQGWEEPNYTTTFGSFDRRDDYYNGMTLMIVSGTDAGDSFLVSDYSGNPLWLTLDSGFFTTPVITGEDVSVMAVLCPVPEGFHDLVPMRAALMATPRTRNRQRELEREYYGAGGVRPGRLQDLLSWVGQRSEDRTQRVEPVDYGDV